MAPQPSGNAYRIDFAERHTLDAFRGRNPANAQREKRVDSHFQMTSRSVDSSACSQRGNKQEKVVCSMEQGEGIAAVGGITMKKRGSVVVVAAPMRAMGGTRAQMGPACNGVWPPSISAHVTAQCARLAGKNAQPFTLEGARPDHGKSATIVFCMGLILSSELSSRPRVCRPCCCVGLIASPRLCAANTRTLVGKRPTRPITLNVDHPPTPGSPIQFPFWPPSSLVDVLLSERLFSVRTLNELGTKGTQRSHGRWVPCGRAVRTLRGLAHSC